MPTGKTGVKLPLTFHSHTLRFPQGIPVYAQKSLPQLRTMNLPPDSKPENLPPEMRRQVFSHGEIQLEYTLWKPPSGENKVSIALHGFSRPMEDMLAVRPLLQQNASLLMVHLAAHGQSSGHHRPIEPIEWYTAMDALMDSEGLEFNGTLIGYSIGGRIALHWWTLQPARFTRVVLLAPDGLVKNAGYRCAVDTMVGRTWLGQSERQREGLVNVGTWLHNKGLLPDHFYQFSMFHLETREMWSMVVDCWLSLRRFWPPGRQTMKQIANAHPHVLEAHFGERDKVIRPTNAHKLDDVCPIHFHPSGHGMLRPDIISRVAAPSSGS